MLLYSEAKHLQQALSVGDIMADNGTWQRISARAVILLIARIGNTSRHSLAQKHAGAARRLEKMERYEIVREIRIIIGVICICGYLRLLALDVAYVINAKMIFMRILCLPWRRLAI